MAETTIFSQMLNTGDETNGLFVRLTTETELSVAYIKSIRLEIAELLSSGSPIATYEFVDVNGDFINHIKPSPSTKYFLYFGRTLSDSVKMELRCSKIVLINKKAGSTEQVAFKMFFIHHGWNSLINKRVSRGWSDKKISEIVEELVDECEYRETDISETINSMPSFIQPYWTNLQTIRHLRTKAVTENGGYVVFGCTTDGKFFFKSTGDLIEEQKKDAVNKKIPVLRMEGQISDPLKRLELYKANGAPTYFVSLTGEESYVEAVTSGAGGLVAMYYDSEADEFKREVMKFSEMEVPQLSDWASVQKEHEVGTKPFHGGRDTDSPVVAGNIVSDINNSVSRIEIISEGMPSVHIGDMVELIIPTPISIKSILPQNIMYSGFYLVAAVRHVVNFANSTLTSELSLMREGMDGKDLEGYIKSKTGKFV